MSKTGTVMKNEQAIIQPDDIRNLLFSQENEIRSTAVLTDKIAGWTSICEKEFKKYQKSPKASIIYEREFLKDLFTLF